jgi:hypothetical protein
MIYQQLSHLKKIGTDKSAQIIKSPLLVDNDEGSILILQVPVLDNFKDRKYLFLLGNVPRPFRTVDYADGLLTNQKEKFGAKS